MSKREKNPLLPPLKSSHSPKLDHFHRIPSGWTRIEREWGILRASCSCSKLYESTVSRISWISSFSSRTERVTSSVIIANVQVSLFISVHRIQILISLAFMKIKLLLFMMIRFISVMELKLIFLFKVKLDKIFNNFQQRIDWSFQMAVLLKSVLHSKSSYDVHYLTSSKIGETPLPIFQVLPRCAKPESYF